MNKQTEIKKFFCADEFGIIPNETTRENAIDACVDRAYRDVQRIMWGAGGKDEQALKLKEAVGKAKKVLKDKLIGYFEEDPKDASGFDTRHKTIFGELSHCFNDVKRVRSNEFYKGMTCGIAQKLINLSFKYCYVLTEKDEPLDKNNVEEYFDYCHMTLDSHVVKWFGDEIDPDFAPLKNFTLNSFDNYEYYMQIQTKIREKVKETTPFHKEFEIWSEKRCKISEKIQAPKSATSFE